MRHSTSIPRTWDDIRRSEEGAYQGRVLVVRDGKVRKEG